MRFRYFFEATDIFGFHVNRVEEKPPLADEDEKPLKPFNLELMMDFLSKKSINGQQPVSQFMNEISWGKEPGAVKLEVDSRCTFYIKKWGVDKQGQNRWVTKKMFQLNRNGYGGYEDAVAAEIHDHIEDISETQLDSPTEKYDELESLVFSIANKIRRAAKPIFLWGGVRRVDEDNYIIKMEVRGQGVESPGQRRVEENLTQVTYDEDNGLIRVLNYNVESRTGGPHAWKIMPSDLELHFFPTQGKDEIGECVAVRLKYY